MLLSLFSRSSGGYEIGMVKKREVFEILDVARDLVWFDDCFLVFRVQDFDLKKCSCEV